MTTVSSLRHAQTVIVDAQTQGSSNDVKHVVLRVRMHPRSPSARLKPPDTGVAISRTGNRNTANRVTTTAEPAQVPVPAEHKGLPVRGDGYATGSLILLEDKHRPGKPGRIVVPPIPGAADRRASSTSRERSASKQRPVPGPSDLPQTVGRSTLNSAPVESDHNRTVLSLDAVASSLPLASVAALLIGAVCMPVSRLSTGGELACSAERKGRIACIIRTAIIRRPDRIDTATTVQVSESDRLGLPESRQRTKRPHTA
jgi:hypothetical protein